MPYLLIGAVPVSGITGLTMYIPGPNIGAFDLEAYFVSPVPEPSAIALIALPAIGLLRRRRRAA